MEFVRRYGLLLLIVLLGVGLYASGAAEQLSLENLRANDETLRSLIRDHPIKTYGLFVLIYAAMGTAFVPFNLFRTLIAGLLFGPWWGALACVLGAVISAAISYFAVRSAFGHLLERWAERRRGGALHRAVEGMKHNGFSFTLTLRLAPIFPLWFTNLAAGLAAPPLAPYLIATAIGSTPACIIYCGLAWGLRDAFAKGHLLEPRILTTPQVMAPLVGLALLSVVGNLYWGKKARAATG